MKITGSSTAKIARTADHLTSTRNPNSLNGKTASANHNNPNVTITTLKVISSEVSHLPRIKDKEDAGVINSDSSDRRSRSPAVISAEKPMLAINVDSSKIIGSPPRI